MAHVPVRGGQVVEEGDFELDGVTFPAAEIRIEFLDPGGLGEDGGEAGRMLPTGRVLDVLDVPGVGRIEATLISAGNPTVIVEAHALGLAGTELQAGIDGNAELLRKAEAIRAHAAVAMGLGRSAAEVSAARLHTPKIAFVSAPRAYAASSGRPVAAGDIDLTVRMLSMGRMHHALTGTGAIALGVAGAIPGTLVARAHGGRADPLRLRLGHPSGVVAVGAQVARSGDEWKVVKAIMSRSARRLMEGWVRIPAPPSAQEAT